MSGIEHEMLGHPVGKSTLFSLPLSIAKVEDLRSSCIRP